MTCFPDKLTFVFFFFFFRLTEDTIDLLHSFTNCSGLDLIFGLNALLRTPDNSWNSSNAHSLLQYCESRQYTMSWELGNGTQMHLYLRQSKKQHAVLKCVRKINLSLLKKNKKQITTSNYFTKKA